MFDEESLDTRVIKNWEEKMFTEKLMGRRTGTKFDLLRSGRPKERAVMKETTF